MTFISVDDERLIANLLELKADGLWRVKFEPQERLLPALAQYGQRYGQPFPSSGGYSNQTFRHNKCSTS